MVIASERWLDEVILFASRANVDGVQSESYTLPDASGDFAIMSINYRVQQIDVLSAVARTGVTAQIIAPNTGVLDLVGVAEFFTIDGTANALQVEASIDADALCLWRQGELLQILHAELDTDATPTADVQVRVKAVRVRDVVAQEVKRPIRLVR